MSSPLIFSDSKPSKKSRKEVENYLNPYGYESHNSNLKFLQQSKSSRDFQTQTSDSIAHLVDLKRIEQILLPSIQKTGKNLISLPNLYNSNIHLQDRRQGRDIRLLSNRIDYLENLIKD